jgi:polyferredoxin
LLEVFRRISQFGGFFAVNNYFQVIETKAIYRGDLKGICLPLLNCYACPLATSSCPIGSLQYFSAMHRIPFYLLGYLSLVGIIVGRMVCGWICPFGLFQDLIWRIKVKKLNLPRYLPYLKYVALVALVGIVPYLTREQWFSRICPWGTIEAAIPWVLWNPKDPNFLALNPHNTPIRDLVGWLFVLKLSVLALFLVSILFYKRVFCRVLCPLGAFFALFNRFSLLRMRVDQTCNKCGRCRRICPMDISVFEGPNQTDCIRCLKCKACKSVHFELAVPIGKSFKEIEESYGD